MQVPSRPAATEYTRNASGRPTKYRFAPMVLGVRSAIRRKRNKLKHLVNFYSSDNLGVDMAAGGLEKADPWNLLIYR